MSTLNLVSRNMLEEVQRRSKLTKQYVTNVRRRKVYFQPKPYGNCQIALTELTAFEKEKIK